MFQVNENLNNLLITDSENYRVSVFTLQDNGKYFMMMSSLLIDHLYYKDHILFPYICKYNLILIFIPQIIILQDTFYNLCVYHQ